MILNDFEHNVQGIISISLLSLCNRVINVLLIVLSTVWC